MLINILSFLLVFTFIALTHEIGHLIAAKRAGIRVYELALGFGPRLISFSRNNTIYAINLIPILGYVRIAGEGESAEDAACPDNEKYSTKPPAKKFSALAAGPLTNLLSAFILLALLFMATGIPAGLSNEIGAITKNSPAEKAGLKVGDKILSLNSQKSMTMEKIIEYVHNNPGQQLTLTVVRDRAEIVIRATPKFNDKMKIGLLGFSPNPVYARVNPLQAIAAGLAQTLSMSLLVLGILGQLIVGAVSLTDLAGPVGIAQIAGKYAQSGLISLIQFTAFLSVNVGVLNLLPIPALDGGRLVFVLLEWLRRKPVRQELENKINYWGMMALLGLMALITLNDLVRLFASR